MSHVLSIESGMPVSRLIIFIKVEDEIKVQVRWKCLSAQDDTLEPLNNVFEDVPKMLERLLNCKNTPAHLVRKARDALGL